MASRRKAAVSSVRRAAKQATVELPPLRVPRIVAPAPGPLGGIEDRARLSLECYDYTRDVYWLKCAFEDCQRGGLDWERLCVVTLGKTLRTPK